MENGKETKHEEQLGYYCINATTPQVDNTTSKLFKQNKKHT